MGKKVTRSTNVKRVTVSGDSPVAGAEGLEPSARGFGDRCSTN